MTHTVPPTVTGYYLDLLARIHREVRPRTYLEIGMHTGDSLTLIEPETLAIGIDPVASILRPINTSAKLFFETSDEFFERRDARAELGGRSVDLAFIDGMHLFEYALRDFRNVEKVCGPDSVILMHDCYPKSAQHAARHRQTREWTGDTWKLVLALKEYRPDLDVHTITVGGSGMSLIRNLNPDLVDDPLLTRYDEILERYTNLDFSEIEDHRDEALSAVPNDWNTVTSLLPVGPLLTPASLSASRKRRFNTAIATHQAKRIAKVTASKAVRQLRSLRTSNS